MVFIKLICECDYVNEEQANLIYISYKMRKFESGRSKNILLKINLKIVLSKLTHAYAVDTRRKKRFFCPFNKCMREYFINTVSAKG